MNTEKPAIGLRYGKDRRKWIVFAVLLILQSCHLHRPMTGANLRAALDECQENDLATLVYIRPDNSVTGVRCIPKPEQVTRTMRIRHYVPLKLLRSISDMEEVIE